MEYNEDLIKMVSATLKLKELIAWNMRADITRELGGIVFILHYPNENTMLKIKLDDESIQILKDKRAQFVNFLEKEVTLSGTVTEKYEKKTVARTEEVEEWVRVA